MASTARSTTTTPRTATARTSTSYTATARFDESERSANPSATIEVVAATTTTRSKTQTGSTARTEKSRLSSNRSSPHPTYRQNHEKPPLPGIETGRDSLLGRLSQISTSRVEATLRALTLEKESLARRLQEVEAELQATEKEETKLNRKGQVAFMQNRKSKKMQSSHSRALW